MVINRQFIINNNNYESCNHQITNNSHPFRGFTQRNLDREDEYILITFSSFNHLYLIINSNWSIIQPPKNKQTFPINSEGMHKVLLIDRMIILHLTDLWQLFQQLPEGITWLTFCNSVCWVAQHYVNLAKYKGSEIDVTCYEAWHFAKTVTASAPYH